jgi:carbon-monoxide dehydrogenase small subunit
MINSPASAEAAHCVVNGQLQQPDLAACLTLLDWLRDGLRLTGTHRGCDSGHCGACAVRVNGVAVKACTVFAAELEGASVDTIEGVSARTTGTARGLFDALSAPAVFQCGFCAPAFLFAAIELLEHVPRPSAQEVRQAFDGLLCRCTGYEAIVQAVLVAATKAATVADTGSEGP